MTTPHDKLAGIKPGDRVHLDVTFTMENTPMAAPDGSVWIYLSRAEMEVATFERIEPTLKVGGRVAFSKGGAAYEIVIIKGRFAIGIAENGATYAFEDKDVPHLERIA